MGLEALELKPQGQGGLEIRKFQHVTGRSSACHGLAASVCPPAFYPMTGMQTACRSPTRPGTVREAHVMNAGKPARSDRVERFVRGILAFALLAGVVWALAESGPGPVIKWVRQLAWV